MEMEIEQHHEADNNLTTEPLIKEADIHIMPKKPSLEKKSKPQPVLTDEDREQASHAKIKKPQRLNWLFLGILAFLVLGAVIAVTIIFYSNSYRNQQQAKVNQNQVITNEQPTLTNKGNENLNNANPVNENINGELTTAALRDKKRIEDINNLMTALSLYYANNSNYPANLSDLISQYLTTLPENPTPGGQTYTYTALDNNLSYQILFNLEEGALYNTLNLTEGNYQATPSGISLVITPSPVNQNQNVSPFPPIMPTTLGTAQDTDSDYLTDIEENFYQTDPNKSDTDGDGYLDGVEVRNLYNPLAAESKLNETELIKTFTNNNYLYNVYYLEDWVASPLSSDYKEVMFSSSLGEFVNILIQDNPLGLSSVDWYKQYVNVDASALETLEISGLAAVKSLDGLNAYLAVGSKIYIISYNVGTNTEKVFETTYKMMLRSFALTNPIQ